MSLPSRKWFARALLVVSAGAALLVYRDDLRNWIVELTQPRQAAAPTATPPKPAPRPLASAIPACRAKGPGFHACMFDAGYAVNPAWSNAHNVGTPRREDPAVQADTVRDPYREGASPAYGVPYWVARDSLPPK